VAAGTNENRLASGPLRSRGWRGWICSDRCRLQLLNLWRLPIA
jgi:hypothetical protein